METPNPYNYNLSVAPEMFFGRQGEVETLRLRVLATLGDSFALIGGRRMGKTSLLEALYRSLESLADDPNGDDLPLVLPLFLDFNGIKVTSPEAVFRWVDDLAFEKLASQLKLLPHEFPAPSKDQLSAPVFEQRLKELNRITLSRAGRRFRLILILDECEQIVEQPWAGDLYSALRYLIGGLTTRHLFKVVMAGSHGFLTKVRQRGSPLRNMLKYHLLRVFDSEGTRSLIVQPTGGTLTEEVVEAVSEQSGGHPFLTQYLLHNLWEEGLDHSTPKVVQQFAEMFSHERGDFQEWSDSLGELSMKAYDVLVQSEYPLAQGQIKKVLKLPFNYFLTPDLDALCYQGLAVRNLKSLYQVAGRMYSEWFQENGGGLFLSSTPVASEKPNAVPVVQVNNDATGVTIGLTDPYYKWARAEERTLARYVVPDDLPAEFKLLPGVNRLDVLFKQRTKGIAKLLYQQLCKQNIQYDLAPFNPRSHTTQKIRKPATILTKKSGTCLDLAVLFAAMCLNSELLPVVVIVAGHAFTGFSLTQTRDKVLDAPKAQGWGAWDKGMLLPTNLSSLQEFIGQEYLFIECTGAAQSQVALSNEASQFPEAHGRDADGQMSFERACEAGSEQLLKHVRLDNDPAALNQRIFLYALDIYDLQVNQEVEPVSTADDNHPLPPKPGSINQE